MVIESKQRQLEVGSVLAGSVPTAKLGDLARTRIDECGRLV